MEIKLIGATTNLLRHGDKLTKRFFFRNMQRLVIIGLGLAALVDALDVIFWRQLSWQFNVTAIGGISALSFFIQRQRLDDVKFSYELFTSFNKRFAVLNEQLTAIEQARGNQLLSEPDKDTLNSYFDLCAEEFFFNEEDYVHPKVWETWLRGMVFYYKSPRIREHWDSRASPVLYYGFSTAILQKVLDSDAANPPNQTVDQLAY